MSEHRSSLKKLLHGASVGILFSLLSYMFGFFFKLVAARYYGPEQFGLFTLAQTFFSFGSMVVALGITNGITRYIPYYKERERWDTFRGYLQFVVFYPILFAVILTLVYYFFASIFTAFFDYPPIFTLLLKIVAFALPFRALNKILIQVFAAEKRILQEQILKNTVDGVQFLGVFLIVLLDLSITGLVVLYAASIVLGAIVGVVLYFIYVNYDVTGEKSYATRDWFSFSAPLLFSGMVSFVVSWSDNIVIGKFLDPSSLGVYSIAFSMAAFLGFFQSSFSRIFTPLISESHANDDRERITFLFRKSAGWIFGLTVALFLIMFIYAEEVLRIFYGSSYTAGYLPLIIVAAGFVVNVATGLNKQILKVHKETNFLFYNNVFVAALNLGLNLLFVPLWGIIGAAVASAVSMSADNVVSLVKAMYYERLRFDPWYMSKFVLAGVPAAFVGKAVFRFDMNMYIALAVAGILYATLFLALLILFNTFDDDDVKMLRAVEARLGVQSRFVERFFELIS